ncbi:hypothetical protein F4821DRAFT_233068 [Hypoxylon rubiginosum]|uniref:Uncharacterized protein n=1 Tax=Hypoxylon rubiginosum TaxID=110542 RepID=A0ACC0D7U3_9PEZI|nr:hypothetical protein F4821DRAFT_233068 [Hypoxylon rubiginosum]
MRPCFGISSVLAIRVPAAYDAAVLDALDPAAELAVQLIAVVGAMGARRHVPQQVPPAFAAVHRLVGKPLPDVLVVLRHRQVHGLRAVVHCYFCRVRVWVAAVAAALVVVVLVGLEARRLREGEGREEDGCGDTHRDMVVMKCLKVGS